MRAAFLLLLLLKLAVEALEVLLEDEAHDDREPVRRDADRGRVRVGRAPVLWPHVSGGDVDVRLRSLGARGEEKSTHEPAMFPSCENALMNARATARLEGGRAMELLTHARKMMKPAYDCAMRNLWGRQVRMSTSAQHADPSESTHREM